MGEGGGKGRTKEREMIVLRPAAMVKNWGELRGGFCLGDGFE